MRYRIFAAALALASLGTASAQQGDDLSRIDGYADGVGYSRDHVTYAYAEVLDSRPVYGYVEAAPAEECYEQPVQGGSTAGTVLGAVVGGALGNQVGGGDGRRAATLAGAVIGGAVGNSVAQDSEVQARCRVVDGVNERRAIVGYDVEYRYRGEIFASRLPYDPGTRLRLRVSVAPAD